MEKSKALRVGKTKRVLASAMITLLERVPFSKITVNDLCEEAMISRSTFYLHFEDKYRLLAFCMEEIRDRLFAQCPQTDSRARLRCILENTQQNKRLLRNLLLAELNTELLTMVRSSFERDFLLLLQDCQARGVVLPGSPDLVATFYAAGVSNMILRWIASELPYSADEMAETLTALLGDILLPPEGTALPS